MSNIYSLGLPHTILRPVGFMENLVGPIFGLHENRLRYFSKPEQKIQLIAVADIGQFVVRAYAEPAIHIGRTYEIAGDELSENEMSINDAFEVRIIPFQLLISF